jgi:hypothetical protein
MKVDLNKVELISLVNLLYVQYCSFSERHDKLIEKLENALDEIQNEN